MTVPRFRRLALGSLALSLALLAPQGSARADAPPPLPASAAQPWKAYPAAPVAPEGAPNILLIMTDDVGFGAASTFGGAIPTPAFDELARTGLRYNAFHTTAMCSPTRASLLTGRNHHAVGTGAIAEVSLDEPGYTSIIPRSAATIARVLKDNGYDTSFVGKNHNTPVWENTPVGPFTRWPNGMGFDYFYGFNAPYAEQFHPSLIENRNQVRAPEDADYILDRDLADHLIDWLHIQNNLRPENPFFAYFSSGSIHSPHQAPPEWIARFKGRFDMGWDVLRAQTFARQKAMGIVPSDARISPRPAQLPAWDSLSPELQQAYARTMEVAAAQLAHFDHQIGRILDELKSSGQFENTLVIYIQGDNGASQEDLNGTASLLRVIAEGTTDTDDLIRNKDRYGGPETFGTYPASWAWATNVPFQWSKRVASHLGGLRDGMVVSWPAGIRDGGGVRGQFTHVIDVAPTIYEAVGIAAPERVDGVVQQPIDGTSFAYTFTDAQAPERHREQYFEMLGNRAYYKDGWMASTLPGRAPWDYAARTPPEDFAWALYDLRSDWSQVRDVAARHPAKLAELRADFEDAARRYHVLPLEADLNSRMAAHLRPGRLGERPRYTYYPGETRYGDYAFPATGAGWRITAQVGIAGASSHGPILVQGDHAGGQALVLERGAPVYTYNAGKGGPPLILRAGKALEPGRHEIAVAFASADEGGTHIAMQIDGVEVARTHTPDIARGRGDAVIGRAGAVPFSFDPMHGEIAAHCTCTIEAVTLHRPSKDTGGA